MKTNTITAAINQWRGFRNWAMAVAFFSLLALAGTARAQTFTTNVIYIDQFNRTGPLNGSTPDTADYWYTTNADYWYTNASNAHPTAPSYYTNNPADANANWFADDAPPSVLETEGNGAIDITNGYPGDALVSAPPYLAGYLPFVPQVGHIYTLTFSMCVITNGVSSDWLCAGFAVTPLTNNYWAEATYGGAAWILNKNTTAGYQCFLGPGTVTGSGNDTKGRLAVPDTNIFTIVLNTTTGTAASGWTVNFYCNGTLGFNGTYAPNPPITCVGVSEDGTEGYIYDFSLTDVIESAISPTIIEQPQNATVSVGQTATFWVNAAGVPAPVYQWMTNGVTGPTNAITGATSATYTTPATTLTYNNLQYSCQVGNDAGITNSAKATLTVLDTPATIFSAVKAYDGITNALTNVVVTFSKPVSFATALNPANYSLNNGAAVTAVSNYGSTSNAVLLMTSTLSTNDSYSVTVANVQDFFGNTMTSATVPVLPAGLSIYLTADSGVILDNSGNVCEWLDQTTNANNASQNLLGGPTARPTPTPAAMNGEPALTFNGGNSNFLTAATSSSLAITNGVTIYDVVNLANLNGTNELIAKTVANVAAPYAYYVLPSLGTAVFNAGNGQTFGSLDSAAGIPASVPLVLAATGPITNGGTATQYYNGLPNGSGALHSNQGFGDTGEPLWIGGEDDEQNWMSGQMAAIMIFNGVLSPQDMTNVDNYLGQKYFTFAITQNLPASTTSSNGYAVTYTFGASQGSAHLAYQWQENGTNIPGATGASYTTPLLAPDDNGDTFNVAVILFNGSTINSATNTLTVLSTPPTVTSVGIPIWNTNQIVVLFNEAVDPATAANAANYYLNNCATVSSATIGDAPNKVVLTTSALTWNANPGHYALTVSNVKDAYGNTIVTASPSVGLYPPNVALWVKANTGVTADGSGNVSQWNDLSGNGNDLITISAIDPVLATNANGNLVIRFAGTNNTEMDAYTSPTLAITGDMSIIAAMNFATLVGGTNGEIVSKTGSLSTTENIPAPYDYYVGSADADFLRGNGGSGGNGTSYGSVGTTVGPSVGVPQIMAVSEAGNTVSHYVNGLPAGTGLLSNNYQEANDADAGQDLTVGARGDDHNRLTGDISELIVLGSAISATDLASLDDYLATEYSVVLFNPSSTNILFSALGGNLTLSWPLDHTGWQLQAQTNSLSVGISTNWVNVSGSTTTNQVVMPINLTNGSVFYRLIYAP